MTERAPSEKLGPVNYEWEMHPDDRKAQEEGAAYGAAHAGEFCQDHAAEVVALIALYPDDRAEILLGSLREMFWARKWKPKGKP